MSHSKPGSFSKSMTVAKLGGNVMMSFEAIVEMAKELALALVEEVKSVVCTLTTLGGLLIGGLVGGPRGILVGGALGAKFGSSISDEKKVISLVDYLLNKLPARLRAGLVKAFQCLLAPFHYINEAVEAVKHNPQMNALFKNLMQEFLTNNKQPYSFAC